ncbi:hypothetical protein DM01DRAFT_1409845 [Hesseltinella vesiculosa]|uniref:PH domain-containing protein n=1 Tax=Hesseltinella vesiculosa TaxID=101127 RepID=A0A1X2G9N4_9FUNG|nr:hypothetical protein DM01DRAFT_1409845 [Hesseltinella vesiculosa]
MLRTTLLMKGWLWLKKHHTSSLKKKSRRYFTLDTQQVLSCYKKACPSPSPAYEDASLPTPLVTVDLRSYRLQTQTDKPLTFLLCHDTDSNLDLTLEATSELDWSQWIDTLEQCVGNAPGYYLGPQTNVLEKWLERFDLHVPLPDRLTPSLVSLAPSSVLSPDDDSIDIRSRSNLGLVDDDDEVEEDEFGLTSPTPISSSSLQSLSSSKSTPRPHGKWFTFFCSSPSKPHTPRKSPSLFFY